MDLTQSRLRRTCSFPEPECLKWNKSIIFALLVLYWNWAMDLQLWRYCKKSNKIGKSIWVFQIGEGVAALAPSTWLELDSTPKFSFLIGIFVTKNQVTLRLSGSMASVRSKVKGLIHDIPKGWQHKWQVQDQELRDIRNRPLVPKINSLLKWLDWI